MKQPWWRGCIWLDYFIIYTRVWFAGTATTKGWVAKRLRWSTSRSCRTSTCTGSTTSRSRSVRRDSVPRKVVTISRFIAHGAPLMRAGCVGMTFSCNTSRATIFFGGFCCLSLTDIQKAFRGTGWRANNRCIFEPRLGTDKHSCFVASSQLRIVWFLSAEQERDGPVAGRRLARPQHLPTRQPARADG